MSDLKVRSDCLKYRWCVLNQSESPAFQAMLEQLADALGPCFLYTGMPHPVQGGQLHVQIGPAYRRRNLLQRSLSWAAFMAGAFVQTSRFHGKPFLFTATNPPFLPHLAWSLSILKGYPYSVLIWDIYPDHLIRSSMIRANGWPARVWMSLNRKVMLKAEVVITLGEFMAQKLREQLGDHASGCRIEVIPNWVDTEFLRPLPKKRNSFAIKFGQQDKITVLYSGNLGLTHGLESVIRAAALLREDHRVSFLIIGDGLGKLKLVELISEMGLENVTLLPFQPVDVFPFSLACGDISIVTQAIGTENLSLPSKTYSSLSVGSAILACTSKGSDLAEIVHRHNIGFVCPQDNPSAIAESIKLLLNNTELLRMCKANAREAAVKYYDRKVIFNQLLNLFKPIINKTKTRKIFNK